MFCIQLDEETLGKNSRKNISVIDSKAKKRILIYFLIAWNFLSALLKDEPLALLSIHFQGRSLSLNTGTFSL
jgi:hypothetical protein